MVQSERNGRAGAQRDCQCYAMQQPHGGGDTWQGLKVKIFYAELCENRDVPHSNMQVLQVSKYRRRVKCLPQTSALLSHDPVTKGSRRNSGLCLHSPSPRQSVPLQQEHCRADPALHGTVPVTPLPRPPYGL